MPYEFYITPEEYERAEANGVSRMRLEYRIRSWAWEKERAITTPPRPMQDRSEWRKVAEANDIPRKLFYQRILKYGWSEERAATQPIATDVDRARHGRLGMEAARVHPAEYIDLARKNGVPYKRFAWRVRHGWSYERAATEGKVPPQEAGRRGKQRTQELHGDIGAPIFQKRG
ncbi:hypothetical protein [Paenibacillus sp. URB8-2]|uniref:hypothetical protein n=1 Tax=Paenibacillus sp. URB8-2 TaxID=2741301 RepID=UPI0015BBE9B7|nr:hypothetical protein [Paenibacillus sp. URB8-2]BCG57466.1 hypothetical protein PUR_08910 [Paenibacillus sp. URB8-2]